MSVGPNHRRHHWLGLGFAVVAMSTSAILVRWTTAPSPIVAFYRLLFTTLPLVPVALLRYREEFRRIRRRDLVAAAVAGVALGIHFAAWFESLDWTSVAASTTLVQSQPLFVALGAAVLLNEQLTVRRISGILVAVAGVAIMFVPDMSGGTLIGPKPLFGNALALFGAVMAAGFLLAGRSLRQRLSLVPYVVILYTGGALTLLAIALVEGYQLTGYPAGEWVLFGALALGPGLAGHTVMNWALAHLEAGVVAVSLLGEPVGATILAWLLLAEVPTVYTAVGAPVVLFGIFLTAAAE